MRENKLSSCSFIAIISSKDIMTKEYVWNKLHKLIKSLKLNGASITADNSLFGYEDNSKWLEH